MLASGEKMYAYVFSGYWKDVGTIDSLYDANMDLLGEKPVFDIADYNWRIHSRNPVAPPHYIGPDGVVTRSIVALGCEVDGTVKNSVLSSNVKVEEGAVIEGSVVFSGCTIARGAHIVNAIIDENVVIGENAVVGSGETPRKITVLGRDVHIGMCEVIEAGKIIEGDK